MLPTRQAWHSFLTALGREVRYVRRYGLGVSVHTCYKAARCRGDIELRSQHSAVPLVPVPSFAGEKGGLLQVVAVIYDQIVDSTAVQG